MFIIPANSAAAASGPTQLGIFAFGANDTTFFNLSNLVNSSGVVSADVTGVGTARSMLSAAGYGGDKGIFRGGYNGSGQLGLSNLVSNQQLVGMALTKQFLLLVKPILKFQCLI